MGNPITNKLEASVQKGKYLQTQIDSLMPLMKKSNITYSGEMLEIFSTNIGQISEIMNPLLNKMHIMIGMLEKLMTRGDYPEDEYPAAIKEYHEIENVCIQKLDKLQKSMDLTIERKSKETYKEDNAFIGPSIGYIKRMDGMLNAVKGHMGRATVKWKDSEKSKNLTAGEKTLVDLIYGTNHVNFIKAFYQEHYAPLIITPFELLQIKESSKSAMESSLPYTQGPNVKSLVEALQWADKTYKTEQSPSPDKWGESEHRYRMKINGVQSSYISITYRLDENPKEVRSAITTAIQNFAKTSKGIFPRIVQEFYDGDEEVQSRFTREEWIKKSLDDGVGAGAQTSIIKRTGKRVTTITSYYYLPGTGGHTAFVECINGIFDSNDANISMEG